MSVVGMRKREGWAGGGEGAGAGGMVRVKLVGFGSRWEVEGAAGWGGLARYVREVAWAREGRREGFRNMSASRLGR